MGNYVLSKDSQIYRDTYCCAKEMERLTTIEMIEIKMHKAVDMIKKTFDREVAMQPVLDQQKLKALVYYIEVYNYLATISQLF